MGLCVSPMYVIYKTLSTIKLAQNLNRQSDEFNYVPVFWLEGEDHDFEEVCSVNIPGKGGNTACFTLPETDADAGKSLNKRELSDQITSLLQNVQETLLETEFSNDLFARLNSIYKPGENWLDSFAKHMAWIFKDFGLLFFNAGAPRIKELSKPFFEKIIEENESIVSEFASKSQQMEKAGYKNQVNIQQDRAYLFLSIEAKFLYSINPFLPLRSGVSACQGQGYSDQRACLQASRLPFLRWEE